MATKLDLASKFTRFYELKNIGQFNISGTNVWSDTITVTKDCAVLVMFNSPYNYQTEVGGNYFGWGYLRLYQNNNLIIQPIFEGERKMSTNIGLTAILNCSAGDVIKVEIAPQNNPEAWLISNTVFFVGEI